MQKVPGSHPLSGVDLVPGEGGVTVGEGGKEKEGGEEEGHQETEEHVVQHRQGVWQSVSHVRERRE